MDNKSLEITKEIAKFIANTKASDIPNDIYEHAKIAFMDWLGVTMAGKDEPLVDKLLKYTDIMGGNEQATIIGRGIKKSVAQAALINGAASHALDYDDTLPGFLGHPSVTIFPSILALSEWKNKKGALFLESYIIGIKVGTSVGACAGIEHYLSGYHGTATMGVFASAAACSYLLGLSEEQSLNALGIAGTQSAGLKKVFGTMCKPFHPGRSSEVGLMAALLASDGFTSADDILEGPGGFFAAMKGAINEEAISTLGKTWELENIAQKYHASCHATHSPIEAALSIFQNEDLSIEQIETIRIFSSEAALGAAFRNEAKTGLEGKFCIPYCVANALLRGNTGLQAFTDEKVNAPDVQELMKKITIDTSDPEIAALDAKVEIATTDGKVFKAVSDIFQEVPLFDIKKEKIRDKFIDLSEPVVGTEKSKKILEIILNLERIDNINILTKEIS